MSYRQSQGLTHPSPYPTILDLHFHYKLFNIDHIDITYFCFLSKMSCNTMSVLHLFCKLDIETLFCFSEIWESVLKHFDTVTLTGNKEMQISAFKPRPFNFLTEKQVLKSIYCLSTRLYLLVGKQSEDSTISEKSAPRVSVKKDTWNERVQELKVGFIARKAGKDLVLSECKYWRKNINTCKAGA